MKLSDKTCKAAKPSDKVQKLFDGGGLYLEIQPTGSKKWRYKYNYLGKEKNITLGAYPEVSLQEAREKHRNSHKLVAAGENPLEIKEQGIINKRGWRRLAGMLYYANEANSL